MQLATPEIGILGVLIGAITVIAETVHLAGDALDTRREAYRAAVLVTPYAVFCWIADREISESTAEKLAGVDG